MDDPLANVTWPEIAQLEADPYWGPRLRAARAKAAMRRLAIGLWLLIPAGLLIAFTLIRDRLPAGW